MSTNSDCPECGHNDAMKIGLVYKKCLKCLHLYDVRINRIEQLDLFDELERTREDKNNISKPKEEIL